jgi:hypothetical protein
MSTILSAVKIASPCRESWDGMTGDDRVRSCGACRLNVYNLAGMTTEDAEQLVSGGKGRVCVRLFRRADGTVLTSDCPVGLRKARKKLAMALTATAAFLAAGVAFAAEVKNRPSCPVDGAETSSTFSQRYDAMKATARKVEPFRSVIDWIDPPNDDAIMGLM